PGGLRHAVRRAAHRRDHARADARPGGEGRGLPARMGSRPAGDRGAVSASRTAEGGRAAKLRPGPTGSRTAAVVLALLALLPAVVAAACGGAQAPPPPSPSPTAPPEVHAWTGILIVRETGEELWSKDPDRELPPASCTKIMTALLTLERVRDLDEYAEVP